MSLRKKYSTKHLSIRPLELRDYSSWIQSQKQMESSSGPFDAKALTPKKRTFLTFKKNVLRQRKDAKTDKAYIWNVFLKTSNELIGWVDITTIHRGSYQMANLGYYIISPYRRQGFAKEAVMKMIPAAFSHLKYHRLEAAIDPKNRASLSLAKKCGLRKEGLKQFYWKENKSWKSLVVFIATPELFR